MKMNFAIFLFLFPLTPALAQSDPCLNYDLVHPDGRRSSEYYSTLDDVLICDESVDPTTWYRFDQDSGTKLVETMISPYYCGTQAPIWINGTHPDDTIEVTEQVCATYSNDDCGWTGTVQIRLCLNDGGENYYVYRLAVPSGCPLGYCVDAATRKECQPPFIWLENEFRCGQNITTPRPIPPTTNWPTSTVSPTPDGSGWGPWSQWSQCSKRCDYGTMTRRRACLNLPCQGESTEYILCNEDNCKDLEEQEHQGIVLILESAENTLLQLVKNEEKLNEIVRQYVNSMCQMNPSRCCEGSVNSPSPSDAVFVTTEDIYTAQGFPRPRPSSDNAQDKIMAVMNEKVDQEVCSGSTKQLRTIRDAGRTYIPYSVLEQAIINGMDHIQKSTDLTVIEYLKEPYLPYLPEAVKSPCPLITCVMPIIVSCLVAVMIMFGVACYCCLISNRKIEVAEDPPPHYEEITMPTKENLDQQGYETLSTPPIRP